MKCPIRTSLSAFVTSYNVLSYQRDIRSFLQQPILFQEEARDADQRIQMVFEHRRVQTRRLLQRLRRGSKITHSNRRCRFLVADQKLEKVRGVGKSLIDTIIDGDEELIAKPLNKMRVDFKQKKYYGKMGKALEIVRRTKESPFDLIIKMMPR